MKKILLPIDGSTRSLRTIQMVKQLYSPQDAELTILMVLSNQMYMDRKFEAERIQRKAKQELETFAELLPGYTIHVSLRRGSPGPEILDFAEEEGFDGIVMTRSSRGPLQKLGSVSTYIVRNAPFMDLHIMHEEKGKLHAPAEEKE